MALLCGTFLDPVIVSATALDFGTYLPTSASSANATITVGCTIPADLLTNFTISLSSGNAADPSSRYLQSGANQLVYNLYTDPGFASVWGDGSSGSVTQASTGTVLGNINFTVYGRLPQNQYVPAGSYSDHITVTISY